MSFLSFNERCCFHETKERNFIANYLLFFCSRSGLQNESDEGLSLHASNGRWRVNCFRCTCYFSCPWTFMSEAKSSHLTLLTLHWCQTFYQQSWLNITLIVFLSKPQMRKQACHLVFLKTRCFMSSSIFHLQFQRM